MATAAWLDNHPKVLAYLPKALHAQLVEYQSALKLSMSKTIEKLLTDVLDRSDVVVSALPAADTGQQVEPPTEAENEQSCAVERVAELEAQLNAVTTQLWEMADVTRELLGRVASLEDPFRFSGVPLQETITQRDMGFLAAAPPADHPPLYGSPTKTLSPYYPDELGQGQQYGDLQVNDFLDYSQWDNFVEPQRAHPSPFRNSLPSSPEPRGFFPPAQDAQISRSDVYSSETFRSLPPSSDFPPHPNSFNRSWASGYDQSHGPQNFVSSGSRPTSIFDDPIGQEPSQSVINPGPLEQSQPMARLEPARPTGVSHLQLPSSYQPSGFNVPAQPFQEKEKNQPWWSNFRWLRLIN